MKNIEINVNTIQRLAGNKYTAVSNMSPREEITFDNNYLYFRGKAYKRFTSAFVTPEQVAITLGRGNNAITIKY